MPLLGLSVDALGGPCQSTRLPTVFCLGRVFGVCTSLSLRIDLVPERRCKVCPTFLSALRSCVGLRCALLTEIDSELLQEYFEDFHETPREFHETFRRVTRDFRVICSMECVWGVCVWGGVCVYVRGGIVQASSCVCCKYNIKNIMMKFILVISGLHII